MIIAIKCKILILALLTTIDKLANPIKYKNKEININNLYNLFLNETNPNKIKTKKIPTTINEIGIYSPNIF